MALEDQKRPAIDRLISTTIVLGLVAGVATIAILVFILGDLRPH
ncbi:hypothetical protein QE400_000077 [Xanthomonas sacchari]|nr:hypothetical protein [Xanthomonas sacchari]MDQ1090664.1 hypothetical protein [Xanthomonas sacchari]